MTITITAFENSPDGGQGLARDTRVRWALEEVGQPYQVRLVSFRALKGPAHLALHPFGQIPTYEDGDLALFETGAIVFHIAEQYPGLLPDDANARARAITWIFAALNTVEPPILELVTVKLLEGDKPWAAERLPLVQDRIRGRLEPLSVRLGDADWLDGAFSAGDLMMVSVLLRLRPSGMLVEYPKLAAYVARGEARPAYQRAFAAQRAVYTGSHRADGEPSTAERINGVHRGSCLCGDVRYEVAGALGNFGYCHCRSCQKASGSAHAANCPVRWSDFRLVSGEKSLREFESSPGKFRVFCSRCGSPIYAYLAGNQEFLRIRLGSLDTAFSGAPKAHTFVKERATWAPIGDEVPQFAEWAPKDVLAQKGSRQP